MHKRRLVTPRVVGMAMLLMGVSACGHSCQRRRFVRRRRHRASRGERDEPSASANEQITLLKQQMALQQKQIEQMQKALEEQKRLLEQLTKPASATEQAAQPAQPAKPAAGTEQAAQPAKPAGGHGSKPPSRTPPVSVRWLPPAR